MNKKEIILVGGGGHCISVIESLERSGNFEIAGISDIKERMGETISGYQVLFQDDQLPSLVQANKEFLITIGHIKSPLPRIRLYDHLKSLNAKLLTLIDTDALVSKRARIGEGTAILRNCFVNAGAQIGVNCIINSGAMVEHNSIIGDHVHVSTGAIVNGDCEIGDGCFIGSGAIISNGVKICSGTLIGAGSVVFRDISVPGTYMGNPARFIK